MYTCMYSKKYVHMFQLWKKERNLQILNTVHPLIVLKNVLLYVLLVSEIEKVL